MVTQISLDLELGLGPENIGNKDGDSSVPTSSNNHDAPLMPVQKRTRRWAAWTRQEEESFFAALRQVGKNFEKITSRVQSKNKDQVRYYYYRLVKRMNKLLGPDLSLDAKNSKDTIAAMLRWWSLLEKSSCKASKMHLKPRRFKIFIETLENQLLKDRKKNIRKRLSTGEENSSASQISTLTQSKASGHENSAVKTVLVDNQNILKVGTGKGSLLKRNVNIGMKRTNCKPGSAAKTEKRQRKTGLVSTSAYKRWEKAAIAGVSLVADAAEHLERVNTDKEIERIQEIETPGHDGSLLTNVTLSLPMNENNQNPTKLKLQLFPLDECTQKALEMDQHNPYLELTLSTRKKISSVVEHLNRKWGNSSLLSQELMLFPYWAQKENLMASQKWTKDSPLCAADVHNLIGSPPVFRLRYGWFTKSEVESPTSQTLSGPNLSAQNVNNKVEKENVEPEKLISGPINEQLVSAENRTSSVVSWLRRETGALAATRQVENTKDAGDWADSLTSISVEDLLTESTHNMDAVNSSEFQMPVVSNFLQQSSFTCDSFDAAIAAHIYKHQSKVNSQLGIASHGPSIWDAEETCDAFAFQKRRAFCDEVQSASRNDSRQAWKQTTIEELPETEKLTDVGPSCGEQMDDDHTSENSIKDFDGITDMFWPDSLGPLDLDTPPRRYHNDDLILSDSLGGLNRLIASSMDAFQSCSFLGLDKKETTSTSEDRKSTSFLDFKISGEV